MAMGKLADKNIRKITRVGKGSLSVTIPVEVIKSLGWREKQKVKVKRVKGGAVIKDCRKI
jgi:antitoxin component of MazEF toxin-antitoxin module